MASLGLPELLVIFFILGLMAIGVIGLIVLIVVLSRRKKDTNPPR